MMMFLLGGALALTGCGKPKPPAPPVQQGVTIDVPKLRAAFSTASPEVQASVVEASSLIRYGDYSAALTALAKVTNNPSLTEPQKAIVAQVTDQINQAASKVPAPPAQ